MTPSASQSVLVYDRIAQNRRRTVLLVAMAIASIVPFVAGVSFGIADFIAANFGPRPAISKEQEQALRRALAPRPGELRYEYHQEWESQLDNLKKARDAADAANRKFRWQVMAAVTAALTAGLALLFWALMKSPTAYVLSLCGARPAGAPEAEAKRLLENLSIGAGLPTPKLYVIDTSAPNAFAAGMDPARSAVAVTTGLLKLLDHRELEAVLAHELSHIGNRDTRLNTIVASIAIFLRLPYLLRRRSKIQGAQAGYRWSQPRRGFRWRYTLPLLPIYVYVFFIAPILAAAIRAAISRNREYLADADGALLTRFPEGLIRALAKVRGAGCLIPGSNPALSHLYFGDPAAANTRVRLFSGNLLATHPPIVDRIERLRQYNGGVPDSVIQNAFQAGIDFGRNHPAIPTTGLSATITQDELAMLTVGNPMGRACRVLTATTLYDQDDPSSPKLAQIAAGTLLVVFDDPGKFRQVITHDHTFGYIPGSVKLERVDMLPDEVFDPDARAAHEAAEQAARAAAAAAPPKSGLTRVQMAMAAGFAVVVFTGLLMVMLALSK